MKNYTNKEETNMTMLLPLKLKDQYKDQGYYYWIQTEEDYGEEED